MLDGTALGLRAPTPPFRAPLLALFILEAATFLLMATLHQGFQIPLGFTVLAEPYIRPATIVETACGLSLAAAALAVALNWNWARGTAMTAHVVSIGGVALGMAALAAGRGPRTELNSTYHITSMLVMLATVLLLTTPLGRGALRR